MTASSPRFSSWPPQREKDDGLELLGGSGARAVHQVSDAPRPSASRAEENGPSIVISPQAEVPVRPPETRKKRVVEPTLVIRDKHQVDELRAGVRRIARARARRRVGTVLLWGGASALAFGFGTAVAFFAATSGGAKGEEVVATPALAEAEAQTAESSAPERTARQEAQKSQELGPESRSASVISLSDLPDAPGESAARSTSEKSLSTKAAAVQPSVVSLEDL